MKLILKNHNEEYSAREIINAHIPKLKIEVCTTAKDGEDSVVSQLIEENGKYTYSTILTLNGNTYKHNIIKDEYNKTYVKKSINETLKSALKTELPWGLITGIRPSKIVREMLSEGADINTVRNKFKNFYECSDAKTNIALEVAKNEDTLIKSMPPNSVSLYVGIPFCPTRCLYCSFTSQSIHFSNKLTEPYLDALFKEIKYTADLIKEKGYLPDTIYIGGGTPTALSCNQLEMLLSEMEKHFDYSNLREFTLEAGRPDTITKEKLRTIKNHNIQRISINPQTMHSKTLEIIGRKHTPEDIIEAYNDAVSVGFNHINMDLIAGLPEETVEDFEYTLDKVSSLNPQSITVHTLSIKRGSYLDEKYSMYTPSSAKTVNQMLNLTADKMKAMGKIPYYMYRQKNMLGNLENIGYCDKGHECIYNIYIMEEVQNIIAIGAGASTKIIDGSKIDRIFNVKEVSEYIKRIDEMIERKKEFFNF